MRSSPDVIKSQDGSTDVQSWQPVKMTAQDLRNGRLGTRQVQESMLGQAAEQARQIVATAQKQAAEIASQAREQAIQTNSLAQQEGFEKGFAAAQAQTTDLLASAQQILAAAQAWRDQVLAQSEGAVIDLVKAIARAIFADGLVLPPELLAKTCERALVEAKTLGDLRLHLHPEDVAALDPLWPGQQAAAHGLRIELVPDGAIRRGGCFIEGQYGSVDARLETQLENVFEAFSGELDQAGPA